MTKVRPQALASTPLPQSCEEEPIRVPGSIQQHGFFFLLDRTDERIIAASENAQMFLEVPLRLILGASTDTLLDRGLLAAVRVLTLNREAPGLVTYLGSFPILSELYSVVTHRLGEERVLEFERMDELVRPELMNAVVTNFVGMLGKLGNEVDLCRAITRQVKDLTGFHRVMLYAFDEVGHGIVLAEENDGTLPSYLGLRFPEGDIPRQARALYVMNTVRIIPDVRYVPSPLHGLAGRPVGGLDLSLSLLRSVSPVHLEYMRNMGTIASMSISIVCEGKLWGLISGHHAEAHTVPYLVRSACDLLTKIVSTQLLGLRTAEKLGKMVHFHAVQRKMLTEMAAENDYLGAMALQMDALTEVTDAEGVALVVDGVCQLSGRTPEEGAVLKLVEFLHGQQEIELFETRSLVEHVAWAEEIEGVSSGVLAIRISDVRKSYVIWFRPEVVRTVQWAGQPAKQEQPEGGLRPRTSFLAWQELVRGQSAPWTAMEIDSAWEFRAALMTIHLKRAEEAAELSEARFQQLTHALPALVWTADDDGQLNYVNQRWRDEGLVASGRWYEGERLFPDEEARCRALWETAVSRSELFEAEIQLRPGSNLQDRWNLVRATPFLRSDGTRAGWVGTCTDVTERHRHEQELRMTEKLALTGRMTSVIAHEINNPLEAITNLLYLLRHEVEEEDGPARSYIAMAEVELQRISGITKQTLRWSRDAVHEAETFPAAVLFEDVQQLFGGKIRNRSVTVSVAGGQEVMVYGVLGQVRQVIANLVSNAIDAVPVGGAISLEARVVDGAVDLVVGDNGAGMSEETQRLIFQAYYSTKGDLGNGLGLYITQEIVEKHGGSVVVESAVGQGTWIRVRLPAAGA